MNVPEEAEERNGGEAGDDGFFFGFAASDVEGGWEWECGCDACGTCSTPRKMSIAWISEHCAADGPLSLANCSCSSILNSAPSNFHPAGCAVPPLIHGLN